MYKSCSLWPLERIGWACLPIYYMLFLTRIKNKQMTKQRSSCIESKKNIEFTPLFLDVCQCVLVVLWHHDGFKVMFICLGPFHSGFQSQVVHKRAQCYLLQAWFTTAVKYNFEYLTNHEECLIMLQL